MNTNSEPPFEIHDLPSLARWSYQGIATSFVLASVAKVVLELIKMAIPGIDPAANNLFFVLVIVLWAPAAFGLLCGYITIIRYPYLSRVIQVTDPIISEPRSLIWRLLGVLLIFVGLLCLATSLMPDTLQILILTLYIATTFIFAGFILCFYSRSKYATIATFLDVTMRIGFILFPLYLPALFVGYIRNRRFEKSLANTVFPAP